MRILLGILFAASLVRGQEKSVVLNNVELWIGMPKTDALTAIKHTSDVKLSGRREPNGTEIDEWCVKRKGEEGGVCDYSILHFFKDTLIFVHHEVGKSTGADSAALVSSLYAIISKAGQSGEKVSVRAIDEHEAGKGRFRTIMFSVGANKEFSLTASQPSGSSSQVTSEVTLVENLLWSIKDQERLGYKVAK